MDIKRKNRHIFFFVHFFLLFSEKEERKRTKERRKNRWQAGACRQIKGIYCESRIFEMIPNYVCTRHTVSSGNTLARLGSLF